MIPFVGSSVDEVDTEAGLRPGMRASLPNSAQLG